jgi:lipopolysaccharide transport system ATP-binding protein
MLPRTMMNTAIRVVSLGKCYRLGEGSRRAGYRTVRESLVHAPAALLRRMRNGPGGDRSRQFWALKDVGFDISPGEVVGIIGRNGAGKSTLLKILSRITKPTVGRAMLSGRVGSLLEVGTGFHPELTGRENIYLNGAILGMSRREIDRKFDEIVDFAALESFLDTPVKRYSSGMYVRLAFAVAAHLEPEIMLVDEVLAVGDLHFQRKCLDKMDDVARGGRTVLLVSHNMAAIEALCSRVLLIDGGRVVHDGDASEAIRAYIELSRQLAVVPIADRTDRIGDGSARIVHIELQDLSGTPRVEHRMGDGIRVVLRIRAEKPLPSACVGLLFETHQGQSLFGVRSSLADRHAFLPRGVTAVTCEIPALPLIPGRYPIHAAVRHEQDVHDRVNHATMVEITPADAFGTGRLPFAHDGPFFVHSCWSIGEPVGVAERR